MGAQTWQVDTAHSKITFKLRHLIVAEIGGEVRKWRATLGMDPAQPRKSAVEAVLQAGSIETGDPERDQHVRSAEFLNVVAFPEIRFQSREVKPVAGNRHLIVGDLTIRDVTREVSLEVEDLGRKHGDKDDTRSKFHAHTTVNRQHFGLHWNQDLDTGGVVLGDKVDIDLTVEAVLSQHAVKSSGTRV